MPATSSTDRLAERVLRLRPSATLAVAAAAKELRAKGLDVISLSTGEPDLDTPGPVKEAAIAAIRAGRTKYEAVAGGADARAAIAAKLRDENGIDARPEDVVITVGAKHAVYLALQALVDPGREVIVPTPAWVSYRPMAELCGGTVVEVPGSMRNDFKITPDQLAAAITPATAVVILNSPSNPCGTMYSEAELRAIAAVLAEHDQIAVISDEIYEKLVFTDVVHFSMGSMPEMRDRVVTVNGLSKAYAMTGWRLGYVHAPRGAAERAVSGVAGERLCIAEAIATLQGQMTSHAVSFAFPAIVDAIRNRASEIEQMRGVFAERALLIHRLITAIPGFVCPRPSGAFYVFPDVGACFGRRSPAGREIDSALAFSQALLGEALVAVVPGDEFGECARRHVRLSFACAREQIEQGVGRIAEWVAALR